MRTTSLTLVAAAAIALALTSAAGASRSVSAHGQILHLRANTNQSSNWFGYNQGTLEKNNTFFTSITGDWTVPTATRHTSGQDALAREAAKADGKWHRKQTA